MQTVFVIMWNKWPFVQVLLEPLLSSIVGICPSILESHQDGPLRSAFSMPRALLPLFLNFPYSSCKPIPNTQEPQSSLPWQWSHSKCPSSTSFSSLLRSNNQQEAKGFILAFRWKGCMCVHVCVHVHECFSCVCACTSVCVYTHIIHNNILHT